MALSPKWHPCLDSLPVIDEAPGCRGLFPALGDGHTGMTGRAPTRRLVKQLVTGELPDLALVPFSATRFHWPREGGDM